MEVLILATNKLDREACFLLFLWKSFVSEVLQSCFIAQSAEQLSAALMCMFLLVNERK